MSDQIQQPIKPKRQPVVMVVDDEEMVTKTLSTYLQLETDYRVLAFQSPLEALQTLKQRPADLVISDFLMPEMDGLQFLSEVNNMYPEVPRILLTGYADKENAIKAINEVGLFQYIEKPWDNEHLKLVIRNGLANKNLKAILNEKIHELDQALLERETLSQRNDLLREELTLARQVQESMLPQELPKTNGFSFTAKYLPALEIGGDFYDVLKVDHHRVAVLIADVTGHGIQAALSTILLKSAFSTFLNREASPGEILKSMNAILFNVLPRNTFVAAMVLIIDTSTGHCCIANGGIPHPYLLRRKERQIERIAANGLLLGITSDEVFKPADEMSIKLENSDCLILYTDGLSEAENEQEELFDSEKMKQTILENCKKPSAEILEHLTDAVKKFGKPEHNWDDITVLGIETYSN
ncbi:MAG: PP2C family protein-serine/threonine phosphatase [bacterium]